MSWKIVSMVLPEEDQDILQHLAYLPHSWTVDHNHYECRTHVAVCHASSHEYGPSGNIDGSQQHQHFIMEAAEPREEIAKAHRAFAHSKDYCLPETCSTMARSHSSDHKKCYGAWCEPTREIVLRNFHKSGWHAVFCSSETCPIIAAHEQGDHEGCFHK